MKEQQTSQLPINRRQALKTLAGLTGAAGLASLPAAWSKPAVRIGALPAYAQVSGGIGPVTTMEVRLDWDDDDSTRIDFDLTVIDPDASWAGFHPTTTTWSNVSSTMSHGGDDPVEPGIEVVSQVNPLQAGVYVVTANLSVLDGSPPFTATCTITLNGIPTVIDLTADFTAASGAPFEYVATIDTTTGVIDTSMIGSAYP